MELTRDGKAALVSEHLCDGLGTCVQACPSGALAIEHRPAAICGDSADSPDALFRWRLDVCCKASQCGRICPRLIKQPGKAGVYCVDIQTGRRHNLYDSLADSNFNCPAGLF